MVSRGVTPAGNNSVLRTGLGGTQSATLRINRRPAYRNLSPSIPHSKLIIFHSSHPRSPCPRFPPTEPLNTESLNTVRRGGLTFLQHPVLPVPPWETCLPFFSHRWKKMSEDGYPGVTPAGNNCVLRTGLGGTQSAPMRVNPRSAHRNLSFSILHSKLIIFHSSHPRKSVVPFSSR